MSTSFYCHIRVDKRAKTGYAVAMKYESMYDQIISLDFVIIVGNF